MKRTGLAMFILMSVVLTACNKKEEVETSVQVIEEQHNEIVETTIDEYIADNFLIDTAIDITDIVVDMKDNYDNYKDYALKHGMIYTDGTSTKAPASMTEITPYEPGQKVAEYEVVNVYNDYQMIDEVVEDAETLYLELVDKTESELYDYMYSNYLYDRDEIDVDDLSYDDGIKKLSMPLVVKYTDFTEESWDKLSIEEKRKETANIVSIWRKMDNKRYRKANEENRQKNTEIKYITKVPKDKVDGYDEWYEQNRKLLAQISSIDFTVGKFLPDYITQQDGRYYVSQEDIKTLYEEQGASSDKQIEMQVYGYSFYYDVSNYKF